MFKKTTTLRPSIVENQSMYCQVSPQELMNTKCALLLHSYTSKHNSVWGNLKGLGLKTADVGKTEFAAQRIHPLLIDLFINSVEISPFKHSTLCQKDQASSINMGKPIGRYFLNFMIPKSVLSILKLTQASMVSIMTLLLIVKVRDRFVVNTFKSLERPNAPFHYVSLQPKSRQQQERTHAMILQTTACMNLDVAKQGTNLQSFLYDFGTNKFSSVLKIALKIDMVRETKFVNSKISPLLTDLNTILVGNSPTKLVPMVQ